MTLCKRLIARLDIKGNRLIKGIRFEGLRVLGDPIEASLSYAASGADEILYIDAVASLYGRNGLADALRKTSRKIFIPITVGGGVRSVENAAALLAAGADKIAVNTAALQRPDLIRELVEAFGSQCIVISVQARRTSGNNSWEAMTETGRERSGVNVLSWIEKVQELGAGEILLTSVDQDGTFKGADFSLIEEASKRVSVPLVVGGGLTQASDVKDVLSNPSISGVSLGAALHYKKLEIDTLKEELSTYNLPIRLDESKHFILKKQKPLIGINIGIVDYGMGNQQSLINALELMGAIVHLSDQISVLEEVELIALPGVGAFGEAMSQLKSRDLVDKLVRIVKEGKPILGICLGMQILFERSEEFGETKGLCLLNGDIKGMPDVDTNGKRLVIPHTGWNQLNDHRKIQKSPKGSYQYFVHSFTATNIEDSVCSYTFNYGNYDFVAAVISRNIAGFQFHPERSGECGLELLANTIKELVFN